MPLIKDIAASLMIASCVAKPAAPASLQASIVNCDVSPFPAQHQLRTPVSAVSNVPKFFRAEWSCGRAGGSGAALTLKTR
jgi:hypothetical protein